ncbi:FmdB family zinc ribbon protein [Candidatus Foliamicus sp.]
MPIYEYECRDCGRRLDALRKISDPPLTDCPECGRPSLKKLLSAPHFRLKGSGWYETDFKHSGREKPAGEATAGEAKAGAENGKTAGKGKDSAQSSSGGDSAKSKSTASGASADSG